MALFSSPPASLCVLRLSAIGDASNASAMVQAIQRQWPETKITWIMGKAEAQLLGDLPGIRVIPFDKKLGWKGYTQLWRQLKGERFDALLHMQTALRASIASIGIKARHRLGFDAARSSDLQHLFINHPVPSPSSPHVLDGFMAFAKELGITEMTPRWEITLTDADFKWAEQHVAPDKPVLVIVPAASKAFKNWTAEGYARVAEHAHLRGMQIILAGSPAKVETDLAAQVIAQCQAPLNNLVGKSSLKQMQALLSHADLVIAPDTGPAHMAVAVGTPVIGLYAHHNPQRTGPYRYLDYVVSAYREAIEAETGKPLEALSWRSRVKAEDAMTRIQPAAVCAMLDKALIDFTIFEEIQ
ncbi:glycosyl transferase [Photobacterium aquae]|uniref:Glycosyl transferase n=1 Tax=Photobacterium aquae TaxID=1195763 RepID=A0A0J1H6T4_9GAMM|nr:glycosyltransferase family 9 protein [Photobacterium aquae]KLV07445.1 glycosyl transferase [Photobacterium aquae]